MPIAGSLDDTTVLALSKALDGTARQQQTIATNIANVETPGFRPSQVSFEAALQRALGAPAERQRDALATVSPQVLARPGGSMRRDGNAVDLEAELVDLSEAGLRYRALARLLGKKLKMVQEVIQGGGGR
jgi:flagellar basal-body rod protein FlgB